VGALHRILFIDDALRGVRERGKALRSYSESKQKRNDEKIIADERVQRLKRRRERPRRERGRRRVGAQDDLTPKKNVCSRRTKEKLDAIKSRVWGKGLSFSWARENPVQRKNKEYGRGKVVI